MSEKVEKIYSYQELSAFCLQISLLLKAAIPLEEGLAIMAEDAVTEEERELLNFLLKEVELGEPFFSALEKAEAFPFYVVRMAKLGQQTGTLDQMMSSLAAYYEKEFYMIRNIKNALTYPVIMLFMLLTILFVLFTKVMPIFEDVYEQLGAEISPISKKAMEFGGILSGVALVIGVVLAIAVLVIYIFSKTGKKVSLAERLIDRFKGTNKIALAVANRRFTAVLALTLRCGMELEKGLELAADLVENSKVKKRIQDCRKNLDGGMNYYEAMKQTGLFSGFHIQMIKVGNRSGCLDAVMEEISNGYEQQADTWIDNMISRFEPTLIAVLAVSVGMILISVMLPLAGMLSAIG